MAGPKLDGQMLPPPIYLHRSSGKVASIRCAGTLRGLKACSPPAIPEEESYPEHIEEYPLPPAYLPKWRHWHMAHQMGKSAVNKSRLAAIILCPPHHPCAGNWERYSLYRKKAGPELFFLASSSKELISLTGSLLGPWKLASHGLWSQGQTSRASTKTCSIKESDDV